MRTSGRADPLAFWVVEGGREAEAEDCVRAGMAEPGGAGSGRDDCGIGTGAGGDRFVIKADACRSSSWLTRASRDAGMSRE